MFPFRASFIAAIGWFCEPISTRHGFDWQPSLSHPNQIRAAVWTCTVVLVLLVFGCLWYVWVVWFLVIGLFLVLGGLWCGLFGCCVSCVGLFVIYGHSLWCFFFGVGGGGLLIVCRITSIFVAVFLSASGFFVKMSSVGTWCLDCLVFSQFDRSCSCVSSSFPHSLHFRSWNLFL